MPRTHAQLRHVVEQRYPVLEYLADTPARKPELVDALDSSRSTVDRAVADLLDAQCVRSEGSEYAITPAGRLALRRHERYRQHTDAIQSTAEFVNRLPTDAPLDTAMLDDASVTIPDDHAPELALAPSVDIFERATRLRGLAPVVLGFYPTLIADRLAESELTVEIVAEPAVLDALPGLPEAGDASLAESEGLSLYESQASLPYALWLMDTPDATYTGLTAYDAGGVAGLLINDTGAAVEWARTQYESYRERASPTAVAER